MIEVENIETWGFEHAIRGMRNPLNSWEKSDSCYCQADSCIKSKCSRWNKDCTDIDKGDFVIGENDLDLMKRLYKAGIEHRKYARQIFVSMDIIAPLYWWKEFDTYKVGTVSDSCSTMHKIQEKKFTLEDFSCEHLNRWSKDVLLDVIVCMNNARRNFNETASKEEWFQMIQLLPTSYNQKRTVTMTYENAFAMIKQRTGHKLKEWNDFVEILKGLPYVDDIINA